MKASRGSPPLRWKVAAGAALVLAAAAVYLWLWQSGRLAVLSDEQELTAAIRSLGAWGPVLVVGSMATAIVVSPLPSAPIAIAAGMVYGTAGGSVMVVIGAELGAVIAFLIARWLGFEAVRRWARADRIMGYLSEEKSQLWLTLAVLFSRLLPFVSFDAVSYAAGLTPLAFWRFALATFLGVIPVSVLLTYAGGELSGASLATIAMVLIVLVALPLVPAAARILRSLLRNSS